MRRKQVTEKWLLQQDACPRAMNEWRARGYKSIDGVKCIHLLRRESYYEWANWLMVRLMSHRQQVAYAIYAAERVLSRYEHRFPKDLHSRQAIEAAKACLKSHTMSNKGIAMTASMAAQKIGCSAAHAAAFAAEAAASISADDRTRYVTGAVGNAIRSVQGELDPAPQRMWRRILRYGLSLLSIPGSARP